LLTIEAGSTLFQNQMKESSKSLFGSGLDSGIGKAYGSLSQFFERNQKLIEGLGWAISQLLEPITYTFGFLERLLYPIFFGLGQIYELFTKFSNMGHLDAQAFSDLDFLGRVIYAITGILNDATWGLDQLFDAFDRFTVPEAMKDLQIILNDIINAFKFISGQSYFSSDTGQQEQGHIADYMDWTAQNRAAAASKIKETVGSTNYNLVVDGVTFATQGMENAFDTLFGGALTNAINPTGE
jgi:hypothetical protein